MLSYPDDRAAARYAALVGMDEVKSRLQKEIALRLAPDRLAEWSQRYGHQHLLSELPSPPSHAPVIVLAGDSGTGKTSLAESIGDPLARTLGVRLLGYRLGPSLDLTPLLHRVVNPASGTGLGSSNPIPAVSGHIFIYDQNYPLEMGGQGDRSGGPDPTAMDRVLQVAETLAVRGESAVVILCVSHPAQIEVAVRRLTLEPFLLGRPDAAQRETVIRHLTDGIPMTDAEIVRLVRATGPRDGTLGYTYGDLAQRLMHAAILACYPDRPLTAATLIGVARRMSPTPTARPTVLDTQAAPDL
jgi:hypothetical protein